MTGERSRREDVIDAILGRDEEMTDEMASDILTLYGITENDLIDNLKASISERLKHVPAESDVAQRLGGMLRNMRDYQKKITGAKLSPSERISQLLGGLFSPPVTATYSFRDRKEGQLPESDQEILDNLKKELLERSSGGEL
jgi:DNA-binding PucR family transcriptional regulator